MQSQKDWIIPSINDDVGDTNNQVLLMMIPSTGFVISSILSPGNAVMGLIKWWDLEFMTLHLYCKSSAQHDSTVFAF